MQSDAKTETVHKLLTAANLHRMRGNLAEAARLCQQVVEVDPENATGHDLMGDLLLAQGELEGAMGHFKQAFELQPRAATEEKIARLALRIDAEKHLGTGETGAPDATPARKRSPSLACALSLVFPGLGQIYNGDYGKGIGLFVGATFVMVTIGGILVPHVSALQSALFGSSRGAGGGPPLPGFFWVLSLVFGGIWLYSLLDAPMTATAINQGGRARRKSGWEI